MEAIPGAAVLFCFGLVRSGRCGVVCGGGMMPVRGGRRSVVLPGSAGQRMLTDAGKQWQGGRRNVVAMTGIMQLCGRYDAVARTLGN